MEIGFIKKHKDAILPTYAHMGDAGMDVYAIEDVRLTSGKATLVKTGLVANIPSGYEIQVRPRSGLSLKENITVWNSPGTIDSGYRGEIGVIMMWISKYPEQEKIIHKGDRIAQLVVAPVLRCTPIEVSEVEKTDRGEGGFGSSGK